MYSRFGTKILLMGCTTHKYQNKLFIELRRPQNEHCTNARRKYFDSSHNSSLTNIMLEVKRNRGSYSDTTF